MINKQEHRKVEQMLFQVTDHWLNDCIGSFYCLEDPFIFHFTLCGILGVGIT